MLCSRISNKKISSKVIFDSKVIFWNHENIQILLLEYFNTEEISLHLQ